MKIRLLILVLLCLAGTTGAQNLVTNPSFEDHFICPPSTMGYGRKIQAYVANWAAPSNGTPDYYHTCATSIEVSVPKNLIGYQTARTGQAYAGLLCALGRFSSDLQLNTGDREYVQQKLNQPLPSGSICKLEFYVSATSPDTILVQIDTTVFFASDGIGAALTRDTIGAADFVNFNIIPQINNTPGNIIADTLGWTKISGYFIADGEQYLTIGNFRKNTQTAYLPINPYADTLTPVVYAGHLLGYYDSMAYVYLDDVSLTVESITPATVDIVLCDTPEVAQQLVAVSGCTNYNWSTGATTQTIAVWQAGKYWYTAMYQGQLLSDTIRISYFVRDTITPIADQAVCAGTVASLTAQPGYLSYSWHNDVAEHSDTSIFNVHNPGVIYLAVGDFCGLQYDTVNLVHNAIPPPPITTDTTVCLESMITHLPVQGQLLTWYTDTLAAGIPYMPLVNTHYNIPQHLYVTQTISGCTSAFAQLSVSFYSNLYLTLSPGDTSFCKDHADTLKASTTTTASLLWNTGATTAFVVPATAGAYTVTATNLCQTVTATASISIDDCTNQNDCVVKLPNAFTPDGDGRNDVFGPIINCPANITNYSFAIYNRWGNRVFYTENMTSNWDGRKENKEQGTEVYFYMLRYKNKGTEVMDKGDVTVLR